MNLETKLYSQRIMQELNTYLYCLNRSMQEYNKDWFLCIEKQDSFAICLLGSTEFISSSSRFVSWIEFSWVITFHLSEEGHASKPCLGGFDLAV